MTKDEAIAGLGERIVPMLQEFGVAGVVIAGYVEVEPGKRERFVAAMLPKDDAPASDGLRQVLQFTTIWALPDQATPQD